MENFVKTIQKIFIFMGIFLFSHSNLLSMEYQLATGDLVGHIKLWQPNKDGRCKCTQTIKTTYSNAGVRFLHASSCGKYLFSAFHYCDVVGVWTKKNGTWKKFQTLDGKGVHVYSLCSTPCSKYLFSGGSTDTKVWRQCKQKNALSSKWNLVQALDTDGNIDALSCSKKYLFTGSTNGHIQVWKLTYSDKPNMNCKWECIQVLNENSEHNESVKSLCATPFGTLLFASFGNGKVKTWKKVSSGNTRTNKESWDCIKTTQYPQARVKSLCLSSCGKHLFCFISSLNYTGQKIEKWNIKRGKIENIKTVHEEIGSADTCHSQFLCISPCNRYLYLNRGLTGDIFKKISTPYKFTKKENTNNKWKNMQTFYKNDIPFNCTNALCLIKKNKEHKKERLEFLSKKPFVKLKAGTEFDFCLIMNLRQDEEDDGDYYDETSLCNIL